jgi:hypothetical protein
MGSHASLQQTLEECELTDLGYCGPKFTWTNCQEGESLIRERLNRGLANSAWRILFPDTVNNVSVTTNSYHAPLLFILEKFQTQAHRKPRFHFEASWAAEKNCQEIIERIWKQPTIMARKWEGLESKLACCVSELHQWKKLSVDSTQTEITKKQKRLTELLGRSDNGVQNEIKKCQTDLQDLLDKEEMWWKQRAKEDWLKYGDRNIKYYHACVKSKRSKNFVESITDERGAVWENSDGVGEAFIQYFTQLFTMGQAGDLNPCIQPIESRVSTEMNLELTKNFTAEEINIALFQMQSLKAPGPDGLNVCFFQKNWAVMGDEVCAVILEILNSG